MIAGSLEARCPRALALGVVVSLSACADSIAAQTRSGVHGMSMCRTPRCETASMTAFWIAGVEPIVAASPMPLAPSGLIGVGVSVECVSKLGISAADGMP